MHTNGRGERKRLIPSLLVSVARQDIAQPQKADLSWLYPTSSIHSNLFLPPVISQMAGAEMAAQQKQK